MLVRSQAETWKVNTHSDLVSNVLDSDNENEDSCLRQLRILLKVKRGQSDSFSPKRMDRPVYCRMRCIALHTALQSILCNLTKRANG